MADDITHALNSVGSGDAVTHAPDSVGWGDAVTHALDSMGSGDAATHALDPMGADPEEPNSIRSTIFNSEAQQPLFPPTPLNEQDRASSLAQHVCCCA